MSSWGAPVAAHNDAGSTARTQTLSTPKGHACLMIVFCSHPNSQMTPRRKQPDHPLLWAGWGAPHGHKPWPWPMPQATSTNPAGSHPAQIHPQPRAQGARQGGRGAGGRGGRQGAKGPGGQQGGRGAPRRASPTGACPALRHPPWRRVLLQQPASPPTRHRPPAHPQPLLRPRHLALRLLDCGLRAHAPLLRAQHARHGMHGPPGGRRARQPAGLELLGWGMERVEVRLWHSHNLCHNLWHKLW